MSNGRDLIVVLGDQLSPGMAALRHGRPGRDVVLMAEVADETTYVPHHPRKIALVLSAMRHFAGELERLGWEVDYVRLDDAGNTGSLAGEISRAASRHGVRHVHLTAPGEWRLERGFDAMAADLDVPVSVHEDDRFVVSRAWFRRWAAGRRTFRMEHFYREVRRETGLLMDGEEPCGGRWNLDQENRKAAPRDYAAPERAMFEPDVTTREVLALVGRRFGNHFGRLEPFYFAVTRADAEAAFAHFVETALPGFGDTQDAMVTGEPVMHHALISPYLNLGLLDPLAVCRRVEEEYREGRVALASAEGFIRQIIGWREYVRGIYWLAMPGYDERNALGATRALPGFYWSAETDMTCLATVIGQTRDEAYAHHIQRLMVTGNFAMLAGVDPAEVHRWYLAVYADAYEWVELPNTLGMSQFADGGMLASKPYAAGGNYLSRMSDYCKGCRYDVRKKTGADACPFNYLYWDFLLRHRERFEGNPRMAQAYRTWDRMDADRRRETREDAARFLASLR